MTRPTSGPSVHFQPAHRSNHDRSIGEEQQYPRNDIIHNSYLSLGTGRSGAGSAAEPSGGAYGLVSPLLVVHAVALQKPFRGLRRGPAARRLRIRMTCAAYHRPPLGDGTLRALSVAAAASAGSATNSSRIGRNRSARSFSADRNL
jgi:hypothetical protein